MNAEEAYHRVRQYISRTDNRFDNWYCGVTEDIERRLYIAHNVPKDGHPAVYAECTTNAQAREAASGLCLDGCKGSSVNDQDAIFVYAYKISGQTRQ